MESLLWRLSVSVIPLIGLIGSIYLIDRLHRRRRRHVLTKQRRGRLATGRGERRRII